VSAPRGVAAAACWAQAPGVVAFLAVDTQVPSPCRSGAVGDASLLWARKRDGGPCWPGVHRRDEARVLNAGAEGQVRSAVRGARGWHAAAAQPLMAPLLPSASAAAGPRPALAGQREWRYTKSTSSSGSRRTGLGRPTWPGKLLVTPSPAAGAAPKPAPAHQPQAPHQQPVGYAGSVEACRCVA